MAFFAISLCGLYSSCGSHRGEYASVNNLRSAYFLPGDSYCDRPSHIFSLLGKWSAIAVNSNDRLDYFGRTVNMAARIQGLSKGDDNLMSQEVLNDPQVKELVRQELETCDSFYAELRGILGTVQLIRLVP